MQLNDVVVSLDAYRRRKEQDRSDYISTGSFGLDSALGGGWRRGRIAELLGDYSTFKTAFALQSVVIAQKTGTVLWLDGASDFNPDAARHHGVDIDSLILARPDSAEEALWLARDCASVSSLIVMDRASGLDVDSFREFYERELSWLKGDLVTCGAIFITDAEKQQDNAFITALRRYASQRVALYPLGNERVHATVLKSQVAPHDVPILLRWCEGKLDAQYELVKLGEELGFIEKRGSWHYFCDGTRLGHGIGNTVRRLRDDPGLEEMIRKSVGAIIAC